MDLSNSFRTGYVQASSMTESVVATAIISICMLLAVNVYALVMNQTTSDIAPLAKHEVDKLMQDVRLHQNFESNEYQHKNFSIQKKVSDFEGMSNLKQIDFLVKGERDTTVYKFLISTNVEE